MSDSSHPRWSGSLLWWCGQENVDISDNLLQMSGVMMWVWCVEENCCRVSERWSLCVVTPAPPNIAALQWPSSGPAAWRKQCSVGSGNELIWTVHIVITPHLPCSWPHLCVHSRPGSPPVSSQPCSEIVVLMELLLFASLLWNVLWLGNRKKYLFTLQYFFSFRHKPSQDGGHSEEVGDCRRRRVREDLSSDRVQQGPVPRGVRAHCLRELRCRHRGRWQTGNRLFYYSFKSVDDCQCSNINNIWHILTFCIFG